MNDIAAEIMVARRDEHLRARYCIAAVTQRFCLGLEQSEVGARAAFG